MAVKKKGVAEKPIPPKVSLKKAKPNGSNKGSNGIHAQVKAANAAVGKAATAVQVQTVETLVEHVEGSLTSVQAFIESIDSNVIFPQKLLEFGVLLEKLAATVATTRKAFDARALGHQDTHGNFEHGRIAITFPETERRSPKWKDEATDRARQLAEAAGASFDPKAFVALVIKGYPVTVIKKVTLTVSA